MKQQVAVVTGASSGIGAKLAAAMAHRGTHVILVARSEDRLEVLAAGIRAAGGQTTVLPCDLSKPSAAQRLYDEVMRRDLAVDTLVNNAGFGHWGHFHEEPLAHLSEMIQVNVTALTELTRLFVPSLVARKGTVLNLASTVAFQAAPYMAAYGATKAYVLSLTEALWAEYRSAGLHVTAVCPGPVETPFIDAMGSGVRDTSVFKNTLTVDEVVATCLRALDGRAPVHVVGVWNWLMSQTNRVSPRSLTARISAAMLAPRRAAPTLAEGGRP
jgi:uncharacterized protein